MKSFLSLLHCAKSSFFCPEFNFSNFNDIEVSSLTNDSRRVILGSVFFVIRGFDLDGEIFIDDAIDRGAVALVVEDNIKLRLKLKSLKLPIVFTSDVRLLYALMLRYFFPNIPKNIVGVTGTDGKSSVSHFYYHLATHFRCSVARVGSLGFISTSEELNKLVNDKFYIELNNTQDASIIHEILSMCFNYKIETVFIESSSQGLHQHRLSGINFSAAGFTNFSEDHIEYHGSKEAYFDAKMILFKNLISEGGLAVINKDIDEFSKIKSLIDYKKIRFLTYGKSSDSDIRLLKANLVKEFGIDVQIGFKKQEISCFLPFICSFYVKNLICAVALFVGLKKDINFKKLQSVLPEMPFIPGRAEIIGHKFDYFSPIILDYAHTPKGLMTILQDLRENLSCGRLILVFGCGGDRDVSKRHVMGAIAKKFADIIIVTDDNPRFEDPKSIRKEVLSACDNGLEIFPRSKAIAKGISLMNAGDILLVAGMGDSEFQVIRGKRIKFQDRAHIKKCLQNS